ncbi:MAG: LTA synthase family protein [Pseudorhodoplanes sp.]
MSISSLPTPRAAALAAASQSRRLWGGIVLLLHLAALTVLFMTEVGLFALALAVLVWLFLNCAWLIVLRRPAIAALLSLIMVCGLIAVSQFKFGVIWMTANFLDILIIDPDTVAYTLQIFPHLRTALLLAALVGIPALLAIWALDPFRARRLRAGAGAAGALSMIGILSLSVPEQPWEPFQGINHVSSFFRSGMLSVSELSRQGWIEADEQLSEQLKLLPGRECRSATRPPHIIMVLDESSFDVSAVPGVKVPSGYADHFRSFDGRTRQFGVEGTGGPTWYTEYNVLTGLSVQSFGKLKFYATRIAAGRVERGLPQVLRRCGYRTFSLYPTYGSFLSARRFQHSAGMQKVIEGPDMGAGDIEPDKFFYGKALQLFERERGAAPLFMFVYTVANHFPWDEPYLPEATPGWRAPGNIAVIDEYIRRQRMSAQDYGDFVEKLKAQYPEESFLIVRFGDHQPYISSKIIDPDLDHAGVVRNIEARDPRYFRTYYAIDAINFRPQDVSSALPVLDAPYLPLVVLEAAGLPLDASFAEQKLILQRCAGEFYGCRDGAEARRFNRLLIDAGLIKGL